MIFDWLETLDIAWALFKLLGITCLVIATAAALGDWLARKKDKQ